MNVCSDVFLQRFGATDERSRESGMLIGEHPALASIAARRVHRQYSKEPVAYSLIDALLSVAFSAPSKSDYQQATVIRVDDAAKRMAIAQLVPAMPWVGTAPVFLIFCADARRLERVCALRNKPTPNRNLEAFFNASVDAALVLQTFILAADQVGLGCCPISVIRNKLDKMVTILSLPEAVIPVAGLTVGFPTVEGSVSMRLPTALTSQVDAYSDENLAEEIGAYDQRREQLHPTPPEKQRNVSSFGYADAYGWSEDKARQASTGEGAAFGEMVRASGFTLE